MDEVLYNTSYFRESKISRVRDTCDDCVSEKYIHKSRVQEHSRDIESNSRVNVKARISMRQTVKWSDAFDN